MKLHSGLGNVLCTGSFHRILPIFYTAFIFCLITPTATTAQDASSNTRVEILHDINTLPEAVKNTRNEILSAARSGNIEAMREVIEMNEMKVLVSFGGDQDPINFWKQASADGNGRDILAAMIKVLSSGYAKVTKGENDILYVWPYFAEISLDKLSPAQEVEIFQLVAPETLKTMKEFGGYIDYRLGIGHDGTWHYFVAGD